MPAVAPLMKYLHIADARWNRKEVSPIAFRQIRVSDLTGEVIDDDKVVEVTIRPHPDLEEAKRFDTQPAELEGLKPLEGLVELELRSPSGSVGTMYLTRED